MLTDYSHAVPFDSGLIASPVSLPQKGMKVISFEGMLGAKRQINHTNVV